VRFALAAFLLLCAVPELNFARIPGAGDPKAYTEHDYRRAALEYNRRTTVEMYKSIGSRNPKWDSAAIAFLDAVAHHFTNSSAEPRYKIEPNSGLEEMDRLGRAARDAGCDDPLVLYCHAVILETRAAGRPEVAELFARSSDLLFASQYSVNRAATAAHRAYVVLDETEVAKRDAAWTRFKDLSVAMLCTWKFQDIDRRLLLDLIWWFVSGEAYERQHDFEQAIQDAAGVDPWIARMMAGRCAIVTADHIRRGRSRTKMSFDEWHEYRAAQEDAAQHLTAAWKLRPDYPESATDMITIVTSQLDPQPGNTARDWFLRATRAQIDFKPAHDAYLKSALPRSGGDIATMYEYAAECADTERYDTRLPERFILVTHSAMHEADAPSYWTQDGLYERLARLTDGLATHDGPGPSTDSNRSFQAAVAWKLGHYDEAKKVLDDLGDRLQPRQFDDVWVIHQLAVSQVYALTSAQKRQLVAADAEAQGKSRDAAIAGYREALAAMPADHKGRYFVVSQIRQLEWQSRFEEGQWVELQPDNALTGWHARAGRWSVDDDGALVGTADTDGLVIMCQATELGKKYTIEVTVELLDPAVTGGVAYSWGTPVPKRGFWLRHGDADSSDALIRGILPPAEDKVTLAQRNVLRLIFNNGWVSARLNGRAVFDEAGLEAAFRTPRQYFGVGALNAKPGAKVRFTNIRLRKGPHEDD
jgi:hypothetical protein